MLGDVLDVPFRSVRGVSDVRQAMNDLCCVDCIARQTCEQDGEVTRTSTNIFLYLHSYICREEHRAAAVTFLSKRQRMISHVTDSEVKPLRHSGHAGPSLTPPHAAGTGRHASAVRQDGENREFHSARCIVNVERV